MRTLVSFAALFLAIVFVQLGSGTLGPLDALAGAARGFSTAEIGLLGSAHFAGFLVGCWWTPILLGAVGHARGFAAMAALGAVSALLHPIVVDPFAWAAFRALTGLAVAGTYTIAEAWLQAKVTNETRGRVGGVYRIVDMAASVVSQGLIGFLDPTTYVAYNLVACSMCLCLLPLALTRAEAPAMPHPPRLHPIRTLRVSPLAVVSVIAVGMTNSGFRMVGPIYALERGLTARGYQTAPVHGPFAHSFECGDSLHESEEPRAMDAEVFKESTWVMDGRFCLCDHGAMARAQKGRSQGSWSIGASADPVGIWGESPSGPLAGLAENAGNQ